jgi:DNA-binding transcriptional regulator YdaS (Cro superfamily)
MHHHPYISKAVAFAGSQTKLAELCGVSQNAIWSAVKRKHVSAELAVKIEKATGIPRAKLRPDLFGEA